MKRILIGLAAVGLYLSAQAATTAPDMLQAEWPETPVNGILWQNQPLTPPATRAGNSYSFGYCAGLNNFMGIPTQYPGKYVIEGAIFIPEEFSKNWQGNTITKLNIGFGKSASMEVIAYITESLDGEPVMMDTFTLQNEMGWNEVTLSKPYTITGKPFYIGYQTEANAGESVLGIDRVSTSINLGDFYGVNGEYDNLGETNGNIALRFQMEGNVKPDVDAITDKIFPPALIGQNSERPFEADFTLLNVGAKTITGVELTASLGGEDIWDMEVIVVNTGNQIKFGEKGLVAIKGFPSDKVDGKDIPLNVNITGLKLSDGSVAPLRASLNGATTVAATLFEKNVVIEEFTGTWCGWCPRGWVGMEYMRDNYAGKGFIGITAHNKDEMALENYQEAILRYGQDSYPDGAVDRRYYPVPVDYQSLEYYYNTLSGQATTFGVEVEALYNEETHKINANAIAQFANNDYRAKYALAFVLTEDHVGPYRQTNYYNSGTDEAGMKDWVGIGSKPETFYNDVARYINEPFGISGSIPGEVLAFEPYEYSITMDVAEIEKTIDDTININNCHVIALLLNTQTGAIENAAIVSLEGQSGIGDLVAEPEDGVYRVYNLQGVKVLETKDASLLNTLSKGLYILNGKKVML